MIYIVDETTHENFGNFNTYDQAHYAKIGLMNRYPNHNIVIYDDEA